MGRCFCSLAEPISLNVDDDGEGGGLCCRDDDGDHVHRIRRKQDEVFLKYSPNEDKQEKGN